MKLNPEQLKEIFSLALEKKSPAERESYLAQACQGNLELPQQVESLLQAHEHAGEFLRQTVQVPAANFVAERTGTMIGRYKLLESIGQGGFGSVWMAEQEAPVRRRVALKVIKPGMDTKQVLARFEAERQALAMMDHPSIARVFDGGATDTGRPYFVMELVRGARITDYCDANKLPTRERLALFIQVCQAVQHAHQKGIIHRDLKPSNILVTEVDGAPVPKVIDFGVAKATQARLTELTLFTGLHQIIGTPAYMSPEQAGLGALDMDTRSDIYALGVLLYELLTGQTPLTRQEFEQAGMDEIFRLIRERDPPKPSTRLSALTREELTAIAARRQTEPVKLNRLLVGDLDWIVMKALEKDRRRRYETANGLAADLLRHFKNEPVVARPPSNVYRLQKAWRRNKLAFTAGTAVAAAVLVGLAVSTYLFIQERRAHDRAMAAEHRQSQLRVEAEAEKKMAESEKERAGAAATETKVALSQSDFLQAVRLIAGDDRSDAVAYLTRSLLLNPTNAAAVTRLTTLLASHSWMFPSVVLQQVASAQFSPDGRRILTTPKVKQLNVTNKIPDGSEIVGYSHDGTMRVWDAQSGQPLTEPSQHVGWVDSAQFSPDGKWIATAAGDTARVWDAQGGQPLTEPLKHGDAVNSVQFSPDGRRIVTASDDRTARVWDAQSGQPLSAPLKHGDKVTSAQFSPDGKRVVTASADGTARVWDAQTGQPLTEPLRHGSMVTSAQFNPNGKWVVTVSADGTARVWDAPSGQPLTEPLNHGSSVNSAQFSPDGKRIVTVSRDGTVRVGDAQSGQPLSAPLKHGDKVTSAQFSPDGKRVVTASVDGTARLWDAQSSQPLTEPLKHGSSVNSAQFSPDGRRIITVSRDGTVRVWDAQGGQPLTEALKHGGEVTSAQFSPDGKRIVTASWDKTARVWDAQSGQPLTEPMKHSGGLHSAQFSPDGKRIVTASLDKTARVWDAQSGQLLTGPLKQDDPMKPVPLQPFGLRLVDGREPPLAEPGRHSSFMKPAQFSPDGKRIVTASDDGTARVWDAQSGQPLTEPMKHSSGLHSAQFSPDGKRIVTASWDKTARVWDARSGQLLIEPLKHGDAVNSAQFSPDGKRVATASGDNTARVWDAQSGQPLTEPLRHGGMVTSAQFSPDGKRIVTASDDGTARVWDAQSGQPLTQPLKHGTNVDSAQFSPDGKQIVTASGDTAQVWDAQSGQPLTEPLQHGGFMHSARFSPDGKQIVTASSDGTARVWDVAPSSENHPAWLPELAEAISGQVLNQQGVLEPTRLNRAETINQLRQKLNHGPDDDEWVQWGRWFLADPATRTISPFSKITVPEYIESRIKENTAASLAEAEMLAPGNTELSERIARARSTLEQTTTTAKP